MPAKMHRMHIAKVGEGVIYLPGGVPFEADNAPLPYPAGAYMRLGNKEFIYAIAGNTLNPDLGAKNSLIQKVTQVILAADALAGATSISLTIATGTEIAKDELVGGEVVVFPHDENSFTRGIVSNNAIATGVGGTLVLVLDSPVPVALTKTTDHAEAMASPYSAVIQGNDGTQPVMGIPTVVATVGQGLWLQVSGPSWVAPQSLVGVGRNTGLVFRHDGSLEPITITDGGDLTVPDVDYDTSQYAGFVISEAAGGTQAAPFIMLQIAH